MIIGVPKEIMCEEYRVGLVPAGAKALVSAGHRVLIEKGAGLGSGIPDAEYREAGAKIVRTAPEIFARADMIVKVKEPLPPEYNLFRENQILYTFLHLAPKKKLTEVLLSRKVIGIAYETIQLEDGHLPLLAPMSEVAGRMAVQVGAHYLERQHGGRGVLLGGVPGVEHGRVTVIGGGTVGSNAARIAMALGATVTIIDINHNRLEYIDEIHGGRINTLMSNEHNIAEELTGTDLLIGAVLIPGACAPRLVNKSMLARMKKKSVIVDVAIDQGGCIATAKATTHSNPIYEINGIIHYCVANMPGAVPRTSTFALTNVTLPYALAIANKGVEQAACEDMPLRRGINVYKGKLMNEAVACAQGRKRETPEF